MDNFVYNFFKKLGVLGVAPSTWVQFGFFFSRIKILKLMHKLWKWWGVWFAIYYLLVLEPSQNAQSTTRSKKGLLQYNLAHGNTLMKKHLLNEHPNEFIKNKLELRSINQSGEGSGERGKKACKKKELVHSSSILKFYGGEGHYQKIDYPQLKFVENLIFSLRKVTKALWCVESSWFWRLVMQQDPKFYLCYSKCLVKNHIPNLLVETMVTYVLPTLGNCATSTITFNPCMFRTSFDTFVLVVNFIAEHWMPKDLIIDLFKVPSSWATLIELVKPYLLNWWTRW